MPPPTAGSDPNQAQFRHWGNKGRPKPAPPPINHDRCSVSHTIHSNSTPTHAHHTTHTPIHGDSSQDTPRSHQSWHYSDSPLPNPSRMSHTQRPPAEPPPLGGLPSPQMTPSPRPPAEPPPTVGLHGHRSLQPEQQQVPSGSPRPTGVGSGARLNHSRRGATQAPNSPHVLRLGPVPVQALVRHKTPAPYKQGTDPSTRPLSRQAIPGAQWGPPPNHCTGDKLTGRLAPGPPQLGRSVMPPHHLFGPPGQLSQAPLQHNRTLQDPLHSGHRPPSDAPGREPYSAPSHAPTCPTGTLNGTAMVEAPTGPPVQRPFQYPWASKDHSFGDDMGPKQPGHIRVVLQNLQRLPVLAKADRSTQLLDCIEASELDLLMVNDVGCHWKNIPFQDSWGERTAQGFPHHLYRFSYNRNEDKQEQVQWGGTGLLCLGDLRSRKHKDMGSDTDNLGRWTWIRLQGRHNSFLRVVSAYKPCKNTSDVGSSYQQQLRYFRSQHEYRCPRELFDLHLQQQLQEWMAEGDQIILGLDMNEDVRQGPTSKMLNQLGLKEAILDSHPSTIPPETCYKNTKGVPIDGIFATPGIVPSQGGYLPYNTIMQSDHRGLWVDIPFTSALGFNPPNLHKKPPASVNIQDPRNVKAFCKAAKAMTKADASLQLQMEQLRQLRKSRGSVEEAACLHDAVSRATNAIRRKAAKRSRHVYRGRHPWSPEWQSYKDPVLLWKTVLKRFDPNTRIQSKWIARLERRCNEPHARRLSKEEVLIKLQQAKAAFAENCVRAPEMRANYLKELAKARALVNQTSEEAELKKLTHVAKQRTRSKRLRRALRKAVKGLATKFEEHLPDGSTQVVETQEELVRVGASVACERFTRCYSSVFLEEQALHEIGLLADGPAVPLIMAGTWQPPPEWEVPAQDLVFAMAQPQVVLDNPMAPTRITKESHQRGWKRQRATTAGEPTALDFPMHIAAAYDDLLSEWDADLRSLPLELGFSPTDYETVTDAAIPKKVSTLAAELMRLICLMNPAYNMNNKEFGRRLMAHCETHGLLADEQSGSRKHRRSAEVALQKVLTMDLLRQQRRSGFLCSNDALQCYDRIVHNVAMLCMRSRGADPVALHSLFSTLQHAEHCVMTGYGPSTPQYGGRHRMAQGLLPIMGILQGNGMGPFVWAIISSVMLTCMLSAGFHASLVAVLTGAVIHLVGYAFVDDTDLVYTAQDNHTRASALLQQFQAAVNYWEGLLRATGGALEPKKTFWYLIDFQWTGTKWEYLTKEDAPGDITMRLPDSEDTVILSRLEPQEACKTLGIHIAMDGNQDAETEFLRDKGNTFADSYRTAGGLDRNDAWQGLTTTIMATLKYPAMATTMDEDQWDYVLKPIMQAGLNKSGISRNIPRRVVFGPTLYQGMGLLHPFHHQELEHWETILRCGNSASTTGKLIRASLEALRLELGVPGPITHWDYYALHRCATPSWIKTVWKYGWDQAIDLHDKLPQLELRRDSDVFLMEVFAQHSYEAKQLQVLNECRMFLRAVSLSDLCEAHGRNIRRAAYEGTFDGNQTNTYSFPRQPTRLPASHWSLWQQALTEHFLAQGTVTRELSMTHRLGTWHQAPSQCCQWAYMVESRTLYHRQDAGWRLYNQATRGITRGTSRSYHPSSNTVLDLPPGVVPASVSTVPGDTRITMSSYSSRQPSPASPLSPPRSIPPAPTSQGILALWHHLDQASRWSVQEVTWGTPGDPTPGAHVAAAILRGDCRAVCDGSYKLGHGTAAFSLHGHLPVHSIRGQNITHGPKGSQCAYRSELGGLVGTLTVLELLCEAYAIPSGKVTIGIDCEGLIKRLSNPRPLQVTEAHYDLLHDCRSRIQGLPITVQLDWIEGHQDDKAPCHPLDWWARQNIAMDEAAKRHWRLTQHFPGTNHILKHEFFAVKVVLEKITSFNKELIHSKTNHRHIRDYWQTKNSITDQQWEDINWPAASKALKELPLGQRRFHAKFSTSHIATGKMMLIRKQWPHSKCPRCGTSGEDTRHVIRCPAAPGSWSTALQDLRKWMNRQDTDPILSSTITGILHSWRSGLPYRSPMTSNPTKAAALQAQLALGGWNTLLGRISSQLTDCQQQFYQSKGQRRTGHRWTVGLITQLQLLAFTMWDQRNKVLHEDPLRHHRADDLLTTNAAIDSEWEQGARGLLPQDRFLFRDRASVQAKTLQGKWEWLEAVTMAREAAQADSEEARAAYAQERRGLRHWLLTGSTINHE